MGKCAVCGKEIEDDIMVYAYNNLRLCKSCFDCVNLLIDEGIIEVTKPLTITTPEGKQQWQKQF